MRFYTRKRHPSIAREEVRPPMYYSPSVAPTCAQCRTSMKLERIASHPSMQNVLVHGYRCVTCYLPENIMVAKAAANEPLDACTIDPIAQSRLTRIGHAPSQTW
jgi:hypothetical protein